VGGWRLVHRWIYPLNGGIAGSAGGAMRDDLGLGLVLLHEEAGDARVAFHPVLAATKIHRRRLYNGLGMGWLGMQKLRRPHRKAQFSLRMLVLTWYAP
jgi:hypothetical protein